MRKDRAGLGMPSFDDGYDSVIHFPGGTSLPVSLRETLRTFEKALPSLEPSSLQPIPTGFPDLDANMGGGLHAEDLVLVVGRQNVGKTLFVSQIARNIACWASSKRNHVVCLMVCYEHSPISVAAEAPLFGILAGVGGQRRGGVFGRNPRSDGFALWQQDPKGSIVSLLGATKVGPGGLAGDGEVP